MKIDKYLWEPEIDSTEDYAFWIRWRRMIEGLVTKQGMSSNPKNTMINIDIEDLSSGLIITQISLTPEMYDMLISENLPVECDITQIMTEKYIDNIGKELVLEVLVIPEFKHSYVYRKKLPTVLKTLVEEKLEKGWSVQTNPKGHEIIIRMYT